MKFKKKILFFVNVDWFFVSHRLHIAEYLLSQDFDVHIATNFINHKHLFDKKFSLYHYPFNRTRLNFITLFKEIFAIIKISKNVKPDIIHYITLKMIIIGAIANFFNFKVKKYYSVAGMGINNNIESNKSNNYSIIITLFNYLINRKNNFVILQNSKDFQAFYSFFKLKQNLKLIEGSGVDINKFTFKPLIFKKKILMACRLLKSKGVEEYCNIAENLNLKKNGFTFDLAGMVDIENPDCVNFESLKDKYINKAIKYLGNVNDLNKIMGDYDFVFILSSYGEGLPKIALEAMACGRVVIGLNNPGINQIIDDKINGFIINSCEQLYISEFIINLFLDKRALINIGRNARKKIVSNFTINHVQESHLQFYNLK